jgi:hypothetical protein
MQKLASILLSMFLALLASSCHCFFPQDSFIKNIIKTRHFVIFWKANDGSNKITVEVRNPDSTVTYLKNKADLRKFLTPDEIDNAVYKYVGYWENSEKDIHENFDEEYKTWLIRKCNN